MNTKMTDRERKDKNRARRQLERAQLRCLRTARLYDSGNLSVDTRIELIGLEYARRRL